MLYSKILHEPYDGRSASLISVERDGSGLKYFVWYSSDEHGDILLAWGKDKDKMIEYAVRFSPGNIHQTLDHIVEYGMVPLGSQILRGI
jgi:hypothetical protein